MVVGSTIIGILGNVWFNTLHLSVVVSYGSAIIAGRHNLFRIAESSRAHSMTVKIENDRDRRGNLDAQ